MICAMYTLQSSLTHSHLSPHKAAKEVFKKMHVISTFKWKWFSVKNNAKLTVGLKKRKKEHILEMCNDNGHLVPSNLESITLCIILYKTKKINI